MTSNIASADITDPRLNALFDQLLAADWLSGTRATAAAAARNFATHVQRSHEYAPDLIGERMSVDVRVGSWAELVSLCDAVRNSKWSWKFGATKLISKRHSAERGWKLGQLPSPFAIQVGEHRLWTVQLEWELRDVPPNARDAARWYLSYVTIDVIHAIEWELAEPGGAASNPFTPLVQVYTAGFLPFVLDQKTAALWAPSPT